MNAIARYRKLKGWTQKRLAQEMGLSEAAVSRMENRPMEELPVRSVKAAAEALGMKWTRLAAKDIR